MVPERYIPNGSYDAPGATEHIQRYLFALSYITGKVVLDAACGDGYGSHMMAQKANKVVGIDISQSTIDIACKKYVHDNLSFYNQSIDKLDFQDNYFDVVISFETIEHVNEKIQHEFINEICRVLKPDGLLIMSTPNKEVSEIRKTENEFHIKEFYKNEFLALISKSFLHVNLYSQYYSEALLIQECNNHLASTSLDRSDIDVIIDEYYIVLASQTPFNLQSVTPMLLSNKNFRYDFYDMKNKYDLLIKKHGTVYFDTGSGFNAEESMLFFYVPDRISLKVDLPANVKHLRFDPVEGELAIVKHLEIMSDIGKIICENTNGFLLDTYYIFLTNDSQFYIPIPSDASWIMIDCHVTPCKLEHFIGFFSHLKEIKQELLPFESNQKSISDTIRSLKIEQDANLSLIQLLREEKAMLENILQTEKATWESIKHDLTGQVSVLHNSIAVANGEISDLNYRINHQENAYNEVIHSLAWKMTKPYRWLGTRPPVQLIIKFLKRWRRYGIKSAVRLTLTYMRTRNSAPIIVSHAPEENGRPILDFAYSSEYQNNIDFSAIRTTVKPLAFYLPQFHTIPENDSWWGEGFTEWTNTKKTAAKYQGQYQPRTPHKDFGYYTLDTIKTIEKQVSLAKQHGIYGFCFYYYWFSGKRLLEKPVNLLMQNPHVDIPFCLCWANENWTRKWDGGDREILIEQEYLHDDPKKFIHDIKPYLEDARYIRLDGKPVILVYNPASVKNVKQVFEEWRTFARKEGIGEILIWMCEVFGHTAESLSLTRAVDASISFPPHTVDIRASYINGIDPLDSTAIAYDYRVVVSKEKDKLKTVKRSSPPKYETVMLGWDNTARRKSGFVSFCGYTLQGFYDWCNAVVDYTKNTFSADRRFMFINAWNEWAEGTYLEPDEKYGYANINTFSKALLGNSAKRIIYVGHDALKHGAQLLSLSIVKYLREVFNYEVYIILKNGGDLLDDFRLHAAGLFVVNTNKNLSEWLETTGASKAICNTVVTGDVLHLLSEHGISCISLLHEMENVIRGYACEDNLSKIIRYAKYIVLPSHFAKGSVEKVSTLPEDKIVVFPQGIYNQCNTPFSREECRAWVRKNYKLTEDCKIILNVGFADYRKGIDLFADCARRVCNELNNCVFMWVGGAMPDTLDSVSAQIKNSPAADKLIFTGLQEDVSVFYNAADLFVLTSREDPFPSVVLEAMRASLPVVAFEGGGGYVDIVIPDKTGALVAMGNVTELSACILSMLENDSYRTQLGLAAYEQISKMHGFGEYIYTLLSLLEEGFEKVSVIIPNYNYAKYLRCRIDSVLNQTYPVYEIIILDDASTDDSIEIIKAYASRFPHQIKIIFNEENSSNPFSQWEKGLLKASGDFIWIAEADDMADPRFLQSLMDVMKQDNEIVIGYTQSQMMDEAGVVTEENYLNYTHEIDAEIYKDNYFSDGHTEIKNRLSVKNTIPNVSAVVFRNSADIVSIINKAKEYRVAGDWYFYISLLKEGGKLFYNARNYNYHRRHTEGITSSLNAKLHFDEICKCQQYVADLYFNGKIGNSAVLYRDFVRSYLFGNTEPASFMPDMKVGADT